MGTVKTTVAQIVGQGGHPGATKKTTAISHGVRSVDTSPVGEGRAVKHHGPHHIGPRGTDERGGPATLAVSNDHRFFRLRVQPGDLFEENDFCIENIRQGLAFFRVREKNHEIDGVAGVQGHADFGVLLGPPDARAVAGPRVNDDDGSNFGGSSPGQLLLSPVAFLFRGSRFFGAPVDDADQRIIDRAVQLAAVDNDFIFENQYRRHARFDMLNVVVPPFSHDIGI